MCGCRRLEAAASCSSCPTARAGGFAAGRQLSVEESVYLGSDTVRRTEQLVVTGAVKDQPREAAWVFEQIGSS